MNQIEGWMITCKKCGVNHFCISSDAFQALAEVKALGWFIGFYKDEPDDTCPECFKQT